MSDAARKILELAGKYDLALDAEDAELLVSNRARLAANPRDVEALAIEKHFACELHWARDEIKFEDFAGDPQCPHDCRWCRAHNERYARRTLAHLGHKC